MKPSETQGVSPYPLILKRRISWFVKFVVLGTINQRLKVTALGNKVVSRAVSPRRFRKRAHLPAILAGIYLNR